MNLISRLALKVVSAYLVFASLFFIIVGYGFHDIAGWNFLVAILPGWPSLRILSATGIFGHDILLLALCSFILNGILIYVLVLVIENIIRPNVIRGGKKGFSWLLLLATLVIMVGGYFIIDLRQSNEVSFTLQKSRDSQRVSDLNSLKAALGYYQLKHNNFPASLDLILKDGSLPYIPRDPNQTPYQYTSDGASYSLCANTETEGFGSYKFGDHKYCVNNP